MKKVRKDTPINSDNDENDDWEKVPSYLPGTITPLEEEVFMYITGRPFRRDEIAGMALPSKPSPTPSPLSIRPQPKPSSASCNSCGANGGPSNSQPSPVAAEESERTTGPVQGAPGVYTLEELKRALPSFPTDWMESSDRGSGSNAIPPPHPSQCFTPNGQQHPHPHQEPIQHHQPTLQSLLSNPHYLNHSIYEIQKALQSSLIMKSLGMNGSCGGWQPSEAQYSTFMEQLLEPYFGANAGVIARETEPARMSMTGLQPVTAEELAAQHERQREALRFMQYKDLERRIILAYAPKYLGKTPGVDSITAEIAPSSSTINSAIGYYPDSTSKPCNAANKPGTQSHPTSLPTPVSSTPVAAAEPLNPSSSQSSFPNPSSSLGDPNLLSKPALEKGISEAIAYAKARWPQGSTETVTLLTESEMPASIAYSHFLSIRPKLLEDFGDPLASFLTVMSCFMQNGKSGDEANLIPEWKMAFPDLPIEFFDFSKEMDAHMISILRAGIRGVTNGERLKVEPWYGPLSRTVKRTTPPSTVNGYDSDLERTAEVYANGGGYTAPFTSHFFPPENAPITLGLLNDTEMRNIIVGGKAEIELSPLMSDLLTAMRAAGHTPPYNGNAQELIDHLIENQSAYGVPLYNMPPILALPTYGTSMHPMQPQSTESFEGMAYRSKASLGLPPELMYLTPNSPRFKYSCCNVMVSDPRLKKRVELLELSDDEESDEAGGLHSLPVSIKREYVLGVGSFGTVYEGCVVPNGSSNQAEFDMESEDKKVAIKAINMTYFAQYPYLKKQLDYEVSTLRQCMGFPAIVQFEGFTESNFSTVSQSTHAFIVMELMGCNLDDYVRKQDLQRLPELHAKVIIRQIQAALNFLHCRGISHCDLKPSNVLMCERSWVIPQIKLSDFGHVRFYGDTINEIDISHQTGGLGVSNNRGYRAPEHATAQGYAPELDMYALGAVSYFIMTGFVPNLTAPRNPVTTTATQTAPTQKTRKGKKGKTKQEETEPPRIQRPSVAFSTPGCQLSPYDDRMMPEEQMFDLVEEPAIWPYTSKMSYHFCREHMRIDPRQRINLRDSMDHEWLSGFEMYSMLRRLECRMGLLKPSERHLTTVLDDVNYQRAMLYMASHPQEILPLASLSGGGDLSNGATELHMLYAVGQNPSHVYAPILKTPPDQAPLSTPVLSMTTPVTEAQPPAPTPPVPNPQPTAPLKKKGVHILPRRKFNNK